MHGSIFPNKHIFEEGTGRRSKKDGSDVVQGTLSPFLLYQEQDHFVMVVRQTGI